MPSLARWMICRHLIALMMLSSQCLPHSSFAADPPPTVAEYRSAWHKLTVPGTWDDQSNGVLAKFDGIACIAPRPRSRSSGNPRK